MEKQQFRKNALDMLYLTRCAVNQKMPDTEKISHMNLDTLFEVCEKHILTACVAYALEMAGIQNHQFTQAKEKSIRKNILLDAERTKILKRLEQEKIWYMPLKGAILKDWYPKLGMRQMSDNDILCDENCQKEIRTIMTELGFTCEHFGIGCDNAYFKEPVSNFEMHHSLFMVSQVGNLYQYYADVKKRLIKDENNQYGYHFSTEDFYLYLLAHEYKHYSAGGIGVRSLLDIYIFMKKFGDVLDWDYLNAELQKLEMTDYELQSRQLGMKLFSGKKLTDTEKEVLDYYIFSGVYGNLENRVENEIQRFGDGSEAKYLVKKFFPSRAYLEKSVPWSKHTVLVPAAFAYRIVRGATHSWKRNTTQFKYVLDRKKKK